MLLTMHSYIHGCKTLYTGYGLPQSYSTTYTHELVISINHVSTDFYIFISVELLYGINMGQCKLICDSALRQCYPNGLPR